MEIKKIFLVLVDISGYTKFIKLHRKSLIHAEGISSELLESIIKVSGHPLVLHELEGDALSFYALSDGSRKMAQEIFSQAKRFLQAFRARERELISDCSLCNCEACARVVQLKLKAILHHGEGVFTKIRHLNKITGEDMILAHRLLKNSIKEDEYILLSEAFYEMGDEFAGSRPQRRTEHCEGIGRVNVTVYFPENESVVDFPTERSFWDKLKITAKLDVYYLKRLLVKSSKRYRNLEALHHNAPKANRDVSGKDET